MLRKQLACFGGTARKLLAALVKILGFLSRMVESGLKSPSQRKKNDREAERSSILLIADRFLNFCT